MTHRTGSTRASIERNRRGSTLRSDLAAFALLVIVTTSAGCAAIGLVVIGSGVGVAAGTGTAYTLDGIAYRTFTASRTGTWDRS